MTTTTINLPTTYAPSARVTSRVTSTTISRKANITLWVVQVILAALFLFAGGMKLVMPIAEMTKQVALPGSFIRFIGVAELAGALGLVLPGIFRIRQQLTPLAANGLVIIMSGAVGITMAGGQVAPALIPAAVGILAGLVAYGRSRSLAAR
jgi:hypothetical protein